MNRNQFNLLAVLAILIIATVSCVYRSSRNSQPNNAPSNEVKTETSNEPKPAKSTENKKTDKGDFVVKHLEVSNSRYNEIDRQIKEEKLLEKAADKLNRSLILPYDIDLITKDCGEVNAFYDANNHSVTVCYELMEHFYNVFRGSGLEDQKAYDKMFDAVRFAFLHEIGHALIDTYNLPITGNEEDAADRCSSFINLTELGEDGVNAVLAAADAFAIESKNTSSTKRNLADEHLLQEQRFYNSLCMIYGSNTTKYSYILDEQYLPRERAVRCPQEYERTVDSWSNLLTPWRRE
jgi:Putative metallopeptidase